MARTIVRRNTARPAAKGKGPMPSWVDPMKARLVAGVPPEPGGKDDSPFLHRWAYEIKWDGVRALAFHDGHTFKLFSRNKLDATFRYPEIVALGQAFGKRTAILDGEIIAMDKEGNPSFPELQKRMNVTRKSSVEKAAEEVPAWFMIFDVLYLDGEDLRAKPWHERRKKLEGLADLMPPACRIPPVRLGKQDKGKGGHVMLDIAREKGLEGVIGKRVDSTYEEGERSGSWIKIKLVQEQELVVGGWVPEVSLDGEVREDEVGAVLLGFYEPGGKRFHFAGAVGTGFTRETSRTMVQRLKKITTSQNPFTEPTAIRKFRAPVRWVKPEVVVQVEYRRWPVGGLMHQAAFKGIREDKAAREVVRELPEVAA